MAKLRIFYGLSVGDRVVVVDANGVEWCGVVSFNNKTFIQIRDGGTYWASDGVRLGHGPVGRQRTSETGFIPHIEHGAPERLDNLVDVGLLA